jgi:1-acyl-sn-glycerol-3-phosphate acyltransferase
VPEQSPLLLALFRRYARRYVSRHFRALRVSREGWPPSVPDGPLVIVLNHPSWWDPLLCIVLSEYFAGRTHYAPMDAAALAQYRFFAKLGFFGIEPGTSRGAATLLRTGLAILEQPGATLWVTPEGRFTDPRQRPARLRGGVAHLARRLERGTILPLALEYPFWNERLPEALVRFGRPAPIARGISPEECLSGIAHALESTQDLLAHDARRREPEAFHVLLRGKAGIHTLYDWSRRLRARWAEAPFRPGQW